MRKKETYKLTVRNVTGKNIRDFLKEKGIFGLYRRYCQKTAVETVYFKTKQLYSASLPKFQQVVDNENNKTSEKPLFTSLKEFKSQFNLYWGSTMVERYMEMMIQYPESSQETLIPLMEAEIDALFTKTILTAYMDVYTSICYNQIESGYNIMPDLFS